MRAQQIADRIALFGGLAAVVDAVVIGNVPAFMPRHPICWSVILFHRECPGCGLTRSFAAIGRGAFAEANALNPLGPILFSFATALVVTRIAKRAWPRFKYWSEIDVALGVVVVLSVLTRAATFYAA
jgi:hypothetical protein